MVPEPYIVKATAKIYDLQDPTAKMGKSTSTANGLVDLLADPAVIAKRIRSAVTDAEREIRFDPEAKPGVSNLLAIYSALSGRSVEDLVEHFDGRGYGDLKKELADVVVDMVTPFQATVLGYLDDPAELDRVLAVGARTRQGDRGAHPGAVYERVGLLPRRAGHECSGAAADDVVLGVALTVPERGWCAACGPGGRARPRGRDDPAARDAARTGGRCRHAADRRRRPPRADRGPARPFEAHLRGTATFRPVSPVVFVQVVEGIADCERLAPTCAAVRSTCRPGSVPPARYDAHAVADDLLDGAFAAMADFDASFTVTGFDARPKPRWLLAPAP